MPTSKDSAPGAVPTVEMLLARSAITALLSHHSRALDRLDAEGLKSVYWPDARVDYGGFKGLAHDFADMVMGALQSQYELTQHRVSNTVSTFATSETAATESYVFAKHLLLEGRSEMVFSGRYLDRFECRGGEWKMSFRRVVMDWSRRLAVIDERSSGSFAALTKGNNQSSDVSWRHLSESPSAEGDA